MPFSSTLSFASICWACFQANTSADTITPTITAIAKSATTVIPDTSTIIKASDIGILRNIRKEAHSNVPRTTINITPTKAASGIISINEAPNKIKASKTNAAVTPDIRPRPPELILIILWPIIAQPPIPPNKPLVALATP